MHALLGHLGGQLRLIPGTKDIWCRDFMPVGGSGGDLVQFRYDPEYLRGHSRLRTGDGASLIRLVDYIRSDLVLDGGNVVRCGRTAITTERIYRENRGLTPAKVRVSLIELLRLERLIVIPVEPGDLFGHADGVLAFVHEKAVLVNDYSRSATSYGRELASLLRRHRLEIRPFPYCPSRRVVAGIPTARGLYINFVKTESSVLLPVFGRAEDDRPVRILEHAMPGRTVIGVPCSEIADRGGLLHCATWTASEKP